MARQIAMLVILIPGTVFAQARMTIQSIELDRLQPFDSTSEMRWIERVANALHTQTKEFVIRRELLFREGDTVNLDLLEESERNLRRLGYLSNVEIRRDQASDSTVNVKVVTRDNWTLYGYGWFEKQGGITKFGANFSESNLAGLGQNLGLGYDHQSDRRNPNGYSASYYVPRLFSSEWESSVAYANSEDWRVIALQVDKPFYTEASDWSTGIHADRGTVKVQRYENGIATSTRFLNFQSQDLWGVYSLNAGDRKARIGSALVRQRYDQDSLFNRTAQHVTLLDFSFGWMERSFLKETYLNSLGVIEDVPVGFAGSAVAGKDLVDPRLSYFLLQSLFSVVSGNFFASGGAGIQGYRSGASFRDVTFSAALTLAFKTHHSGVAAANFTGTFGSNWTPGAQLYLDSRNMLRGIPAYALSGNRRLTFNLEDRLDNGLEFWYFKTGSVFFLDGGMIWMEGSPVSRARFSKSAGYGIRIMNDRLIGAGVLRIDFAYNFDRRDLEVILTTNQLFSVFGGVETVSPVSY